MLLKKEKNSWECLSFLMLFSLWAISVGMRNPSEKRKAAQAKQPQLFMSPHGICSHCFPHKAPEGKV